MPRPDSSSMSRLSASTGYPVFSATTSSSSAWRSGSWIAAETGASSTGNGACGEALALRTGAAEISGLVGLGGHAGIGVERAAGGSAMALSCRESVSIELSVSERLSRIAACAAFCDWLIWDWSSRMASSQALPPVESEARWVGGSVFISGVMAAMAAALELRSLEVETEDGGAGMLAGRVSRSGLGAGRPAAPLRGGYGRL